MAFKVTKAIGGFSNRVWVGLGWASGRNDFLTWTLGQGIQHTAYVRLSKVASLSAHKQRFLFDFVCVFFCRRRCNGGGERRGNALPIVCVSCNSFLRVHGTRSRKGMEKRVAQGDRREGWILLLLFLADSPSPRAFFLSRTRTRIVMEV